VTDADADVRFDDAAGLLVRPYTVTGGRTRPAAEFHLITLVAATGRQLGEVSPEHDRILGVCRWPTSVAEISAHLRLPIAVVKILLADLLGWRAVVTRAPVAFPDAVRPDRHVLEAVLNALRAL
jgi:Protein of unknown function (DUF742)